MKLSLIIPVYNEEAHLEEVVDRLMKSPCPIEREWIFVDDHSSDKSREILENLQKTHSFKVFHQNPNQGKGAALARGIREAEVKAMSTGNHHVQIRYDIECPGNRGNTVF